MKSTKLSFILLLLLIPLFSLPILLEAKKSKILLDFYKLEQKSWAEYIQAYQKIDKFYARTQDNFDVKFYHIDIEINIYNPYIIGSVYTKFDITQDNTSQIKLNLDDALSVIEITGNSDSYSTVSDSIFVTLDRIYNSGEEVEITIAYGGVPEMPGGYKGLRYETHNNGNEPIIATLSTPYLAHSWWPCKDGPGDKPDSVYIDITVPDTLINNIPLLAISNGLLISETPVSKNNRNFKKFEWKHRYPIVPYYVMAAISNYEIIHEDYVDSNSDSISFDLDYYTFNETYSASHSGVEDIPEVLDFFNSVYGPYPFRNEKYGMTELGFYGGIENQTNSIMGAMSLGWFSVTVHELSHMWFADMITCENWHHGWLNEGFANYSEALWDENKYGFEEYKLNMNSNLFLQGGTLYLDDVSNPFNGVFVSIIYQKGAYLLHMLRNVLGDELFFESIYAYSTSDDFMYDHVVTEDFRQVCEDVSELDLEMFFEQWVYDEYYPKYEVDFYQNQSNNFVSLTIRQTQENFGWRPVFEMPVEIKFEFENNTDTLVTVMNNQKDQLFEFDFSEEVSNVLFDPDRWLLRDSNINVTGIEGNYELLITNYELKQNYPNPFNPTTKIRYHLDVKAMHASSLQADIVVYNVTGQQVWSQNLSTDHSSPITSYCTFDGSKFNSGVYYYSLVVDGKKIDTKSMILIK